MSRYVGDIQLEQQHKRAPKRPHRAVLAMAAMSAIVCNFRYHYVWSLWDYQPLAVSSQ